MRRQAFSLAELLVALVLLAVGIAAFARAAGAVARLESRTVRRRAAATALTARLDSLATVPCDASMRGLTALDGVQARWTATPDTARWLVQLDIDAPASSALSRRWQASVPCPP
jgi:prepilin-type N-terminal cleavage/methylation domain-containing protein